MTIQQEASTLISELPDDSVRILIELIRKLNPAKSDMPKKGKRTLGYIRYYKCEPLLHKTLA